VLPHPRADGASAMLGGVVLLVGGITPEGVSADVITLEYAGGSLRFGRVRSFRLPLQKRERPRFRVYFGGKLPHMSTELEFDHLKLDIYEAITLWNLSRFRLGSVWSGWAERIVDGQVQTEHHRALR